MQASGSLVDVDIPELSESPWPGMDIFCTRMGLWCRIVKELDPKLTLGMAERGDELSLQLMRNHGEGVSGSNLGQTQSHHFSDV